MKPFFFLYFILFYGSCVSDHGLSLISTISETDSAPNIIVEPQIIDFGSINAIGEVESRVVTVTNIGINPLKIEDIKFASQSNEFSFTYGDNIDELEQYNSFEIIVSYDPSTYEDNTNVLYVLSNDPEDRSVAVHLSGMGDAPVISLSPADHNFTNSLYGCEESTDIYISNVGNVNLIIDRIDYFITYPPNLGIEDFETTYGPLPWNIAPGGGINLNIFLEPRDDIVDYGTLDVYSNDPETPVATAIQTANVDYGPTIEENFHQTLVNSVDILFVVDNSGSMGSKQTQLANNIDTFMNVFTLSGIDYHIGFITTDSYDTQGPLITSSTQDPVTTAVNIIQNIGVNGDYIEKGIDYSYFALQPGYDFGPGSAFWRKDSKLIIIYISDEDDQSTSVSIADLKNYIFSAKGSPNYAVGHAVAGDYPGGCSSNGGGAEAYDYYTLTNELNGTFLSICLDDWGTPLEYLANESILRTAFALSQQPIPETIYVEVNGVQSIEWGYDMSSNSIIFNAGHIPNVGSDVKIEYSPMPEC